MWRMHGEVCGRVGVGYPFTLAEIWHGKIYVSVQMNLRDRFRDEFPVPAIRLSRWHVTLAVAYYRIWVPWRTANLFAAFTWWARHVEIEQLNNICNQVWDFTVHAPNGETNIPLVRPPWRRSATFGIGWGSFYTGLVVVRHLSEQVLVERGHRLRTRREIHTSWN